MLYPGEEYLQSWRRAIRVTCRGTQPVYVFLRRVFAQHRWTLQITVRTQPVPASSASLLGQSDRVCLEQQQEEKRTADQTNSTDTGTHSTFSVG